MAESRKLQTNPGENIAIHVDLLPRAVFYLFIYFYLVAGPWVSIAKPTSQCRGKKSENVLSSNQVKQFADNAKQLPVTSVLRAYRREIFSVLFHWLSVK